MIARVAGAAAVYDAERHSRTYYEGRARWYDLANRLAALLRGTSQLMERRKAVDKLRLRAGGRALEVSVGTGTNVPLLAEQLGPAGRIVGIDISRAMLRRCDDKARQHSIGADLVDAEAAHLPFADETFDAVFHHGGLAEFGDKRGAIAEMTRVGKTGARIVICDAGLPSNRNLPLMSRLLLRMQPAYRQGPPMELLPADAEDVQVSWFHGDAWYAIEFVKPETDRPALRVQAPS